MVRWSFTCSTHVLHQNTGYLNVTGNPTDNQKLIFKGGQLEIISTPLLTTRLVYLIHLVGIKWVWESG